MGYKVGGDSTRVYFAWPAATEHRPSAGLPIALSSPLSAPASRSKQRPDTPVRRVSPRVFTSRGREGPEMFDSNMTVIRTTHSRRRAFDEEDFDVPSISRRTANLSSQAMDDAGAIRNASRVRDASLLNDITARLDSADFIAPVQVSHRRHVLDAPARPLRATSMPPPSARRLANFDEGLDFPEYRPPVRHFRPPTTSRYEFGLDDYYGLEDEMPETRRIYPTRTVVTSSHHQHSPSVLARRPPIPARVHPRAAKYIDSEFEYSSSPPPASMGNLRTRAAECRSKMDHQKVLLDRYLPIHMGPENEVEAEVEAKYGELAARMPALDPSLRNTRDRTARSSSVPPYRPSQTARNSAEKEMPNNYGLRGISCRPPVSDIRKRCREVLCKTKNDPTYFNY